MAFHTVIIMENKAANGQGDFFEPQANQRSFQAVAVGAGAVTADVKIHGSNDGVNICATEMGTISLAGNNTVSDGFTTNAPWKYIAAVLSNISGVGTKVKVIMGE